MSYYHTLMAFRYLVTGVLLFAAQQCAVGGIIVGDSDVQQQISIVAVMECMAPEDGMPFARWERSSNEVDDFDLSRDASATPVAASPRKAISVCLTSSEKLHLADSWPPPKPDLDGLLKPPEYTLFECMVGLFVK